MRDWGTDPLFWIGIIGLPLVWFAFTGRTSWGARRFLPAIFSLLWVMVLVLVSAPVVVNPQVDAWETQFPLDESCASDSPIVLLGAGLHRYATDAEQTEYLYPSAHVRSARAAAMAVMSLDAPILVSGAGLQKITEADMMQAYLRQRGVQPSRVVLDAASRNTRESALKVAAIVNEKGWGAKLRLVTSAVHMPRAMGVFQTSGLEPCAIPVEPLAVRDVPWYAMAPQTTALSKYRTYLHERIGVWVYQSKGWL